MCVNSTGEPVHRDRESKKNCHCSVSEMTAPTSDPPTSSVVSVGGSMLWGKRHNFESEILRRRQNVHEFLERQAHTAVQGE